MKKFTTFIRTMFLFAMFATLTITTGTVSAVSTNYKVSIPVETIMYTPAGSNTQIASEAIDTKYQGMVCEVHANALNQGSVHPNNNLIVESGSTSVTAYDVERASGVSTKADGMLTLGSNVKVLLHMGDDAVFSAGMDVVLSCNEPTVEVCRDGKVITIDESNRKSTDTNAPCPVKINVCRDDEVITINEGDRKSTDTNAPCPVVQIEVCRDGKVITINEDDKKSSDTSAPCPEIVTVKVCRDGHNVLINESDRRTTDTDAPCPVTVPKELPKTGAGSIAAIFSSVVLATFAAAQIRLRRSNR